MTKVEGLELPPLDEEYDADTLAFLRAQRIYQVIVVCYHLEVKYSDGRVKEMNIGC